MHKNHISSINILEQFTIPFILNQQQPSDNLQTGKRGISGTTVTVPVINCCEKISHTAEIIIDRHLLQVFSYSLNFTDLIIQCDCAFLAYASERMS